MIALDTTPKDGAKLKVIGVGGGGGNAINSMITLGLDGVDFIAANTDKQALDHNLANVTIQIGVDTTSGLGAGANPEIGKASVEENYEEIKEVLKGSDMVFVTAGMGGGTGTGGAPVMARVAQELGALVVGIVTKPFVWEGRKRIVLADKGITELRKHVDALIVIPNQKLLDIIDKNTTFGEAFQKVDEVLYNATRGIADIISRHGMVNVDFADVTTIMKGMGDALMGIGTSSGEHRAVEATQNALNSPLLDGISIAGAKGVLVNITGGSDMTMHEITEAVTIVEQAAGEDVNLIHGVVYNSEPSEDIMVTVVATGFNSDTEEEVEAEAKVEEEKPKLPFQEKPQKPVFKPRTGLGFGKTMNMDNVANENTNYITSKIKSSPKGLNQLKKYDKPAYERRAVRNYEEDHNEMNMSSKMNDGSQTKFLRTIMD